MASERNCFGDKLRAVRERKGLTMKSVAEKAGVSESLISQIERNRISPAIDTLLSIAEILEIDLEYLFADFKRERPVQLVRSSERTRIVTRGVVYERLSSTAPGAEEHGIEAYVLELPAGKEHGSTEYGHIGKELGLIISGCAEFKIGSKTYALGEGDSISFSSDIPHVLCNCGSTPLKAFWVVTPPKGDF